MSAFLTFLHTARRRVWRLVRRETRGVKVMLFNDAGELLLVRHGYGRSDLFMLPGGGVRPFEAPERAAAREVREELGCGMRGLLPVSVHVSTIEGRRDTVHLFRAQIDGQAVPDGIELVEARFFALDAPPANTSPATLRRISEHLGTRTATSDW